MTAPLPPLPEPDMEAGGDSYCAWPDQWEAESMHSYAKLAVRQALERLLEKETYEYARARIRVMIEEYK